MSGVTEAPVFDVGNYLDQRAERSPFTMIELGHGQYPLVANQPQFFVGDKAYIGIEAGVRSGLEKALKLRDRLRVEYGTVNATFMVHDLGGTAVSENADVAEGEYRGEFKAQTPLPPGLGHEVVASNVFGDDLIASSFVRTISLLGEMSRLTTQDGTVILRETITPDQSSFLHELAVQYTAEYAGLEVVGRVGSDTLDWDQLELLYGTHKEWPQSANPYPEAFYLFLAKSTQAETAAAPNPSL